MKKNVSMLLLLVSSATFAGAECEGTIDGVFVDYNGYVTMQPSWRGDWIRLCNLNFRLNGIDVATCSTWSSYVAKAVESRLQTITYFSGVTGCNVLPTYDETPPTSYFMIKPKQS